MHTDTSAAARTPRGRTLLFAVACGIIVANLYYAQPLIGLIAPDVGVPPSLASLMVTLTQLGYGAGLILLVPLGDLVENRGLVVWTLLSASAALGLAAWAQSPYELLTAMLFVGVGSVTVQMLVPLAAHLAPAATRGRTVGNVMSGLLAGIMLARPVSSLVASAFGWRAVLGASAVLMLVLVPVLRILLPPRTPVVQQRYGALIASLMTLLRATPVLRRRALYQAALFAAFSLYWTAVPLLLSGPHFDWTQREIALFSFAGVAGVFSAPVAGRVADRGWTRGATAVALISVALAFAFAALGAQGSWRMLLAGGILLDLGVQANLVLGQRTIYALGSEVRSRLNALYMALFFGGGALGSALASVTLARGGWIAVCALGLGFTLIALLYYATERS